MKTLSAGRRRSSSGRAGEPSTIRRRASPLEIEASMRIGCVWDSGSPGSASSSASTRATSAPNVIVSRSRRVRQEAPVRAKKSASRTLVLPAPFGPCRTVSPGPSSIVSSARFRNDSGSIRVTFTPDAPT